MHNVNTHEQAEYYVRTLNPQLQLSRSLSGDFVFRRLHPRFPRCKAAAFKNVHSE